MTLPTPPDTAASGSGESRRFPTPCHYWLGALIEALEAEDPSLVCPRGFARPHSYRGYYDELAFEPARDVTVGEMLAAAKSALGSTYGGWKGGDYTMSEYTYCWLAYRGDTGETLGAVLVSHLLRDAAAGEPS
jgi:hypothetical protein